MTTNEDPVYNIKLRWLAEVNTDPQRRVHNGVHVKSEMRLTEWRIIEPRLSFVEAERRLKFWHELNEYAVSQRGPEASIEYKIFQELEDQPIKKEPL